MILMKNVSFKYEGSENYSLKDINLTLEKGECLLVTGPSGGGKSTLTKLINGLIPAYFEGELKGEIYIDGINISDIPMYELSGKVASVFQNPKTQFFNIDAEDEMAFALENQGVDEKIITERLERAADELGIKKLMTKNIFEMSGGEKQIIAFAGAYVSDAEVIVLDEPSANLDREHMEIIRDIMKKLMNQNKMIIIAEHRLAYLRNVATRACYMKNGQILETFTAEEFYGMSENKRCEMGLRELSAVTANDNFEAEGKEKTDISVKNMKLKYQAFNGKELNLSFNYGEVIGIVGHNGLGKSTFIRTLCGIIREKKGEICISGRRGSCNKRKKKCGMVMQDVNYQLFSDSVVLECKLGNGQVSDKEIYDILEELSLLDKKDVHPMSLSGGEKQRLAIATMLAGGKKIMMLDEPTSGLDYENMMRISRLLKKVAEKGTLCLVVTHDTEFIREACSRIIAI